MYILSVNADSIVSLPASELYRYISECTREPTTKTYQVNSCIITFMVDICIITFMINTYIITFMANTCIIMFTVKTAILLC